MDRVYVKYDTPSATFLRSFKSWRAWNIYRNSNQNIISFDILSEIEFYRLAGGGLSC